MLVIKDSEIGSLSSLMRSKYGETLLAVLERFVNNLADVRNMQGLSADMRVMCIEMLDKELIQKLKQLSGKVDVPDKNEYI